MRKIIFRVVAAVGPTCAVKMAKQRLDLSEQVPPTAKHVMLEFEIQPSTASVLVYRREGDLFPNLLRGTGKQTVLLLTPQTLFIYALADVTSHSIAVSGYTRSPIIFNERFSPTVERR